MERTDHIADVVARIAALPGGRVAQRQTEPDDRRSEPSRRVAGGQRAARPAPRGGDDEDEFEGAPF